MTNFELHTHDQVNRIIANVSSTVPSEVKDKFSSEVIVDITYACSRGRAMTFIDADPYSLPLQYECQVSNSPAIR